MRVYDHSFNGNEWFILSGLFIEILILVFIPKRFPLKTAIAFFMCGVFVGFLFDHSLSVQPVSFYDVNDSSSYQLMDFISYITYGPISYLFFHFYDRYRSIPAPLYVLITALFSICLEWLSDLMGVFHYQHGYTLYYSFPIYLIVQSSWILFYNRYRGVHSAD